ncbi:O-antigen ligase family protein [Parerythrobacter aestuarii]|uniref:O-antigen ligase family protein n=1 Tax=Parerythrobacter aestuarii TaxID=3020909 RepID=UPI0024DE6A80|nr:O-antigen ligase family protein [Parerythrobacter aestuarii]
MGNSEKRVTSRKADLILLGLLALVAALLGGSSRPDPVQLAALRPLSALFLIPAVYALYRVQLQQARFLVILFAALAVWMLIQLIPLPPGIWHSLPGREPIVAMDAALGLQDLWRPIAMSPVRGWNALASLVLPLAGLLLAMAAGSNWRTLLLAVAALGTLDALLGLLQVASGPTSPLYFYAFSSRGAPVGIFANENHSAVFSACTLLVLTRLGLDTARNQEAGLMRMAYMGAFLLVVVAALVSGSRAGFIAAFIAMAGSGLMVWTSLDPARKPSRSRAAQFRFRPGPRLLVGIGFALALAVPAAFFAFDRMPGFSDLLARDAFQDLRWAIWPTISDMVVTYWTVGAGFGSFEEVYHIFEPTALLGPKYINMAHNDWAQLVFEGGIPAAAILLALLGWVGRSIWRIGGSRQEAFPARIFWVAVFAIIAFASVFDYPLRAPVFQLTAIWLLLALAFENGRTDAAPSGNKNAALGLGA